MQLYNTLKRKKEEFTPIRKENVGIYVCGPTVYDYPHIGHGRTYIAFDILVRYLRYKGYKVKYIVNITNIDDKIIQRGKETGRNPIEIAKEFEGIFHEDMNALNVRTPDYYPQVSKHIEDIINLIERLLKNGFAYERGGDVYYSIEKFKGYGKLSGQSVDDLIAGARVKKNARKKHPMDFTLWKKGKKNEVSWPSPWGTGRPGWHIECSAMSMKYLGKSLDIHGGAMDLIFPHHENEILQVESVTNKKFVKYWVHTGFLNVNGEKMSKSLGNFITIRDLLDKYNPEVFRFYISRAHYRSPINFSYNGIENASKSLEKIVNAYKYLEDNLGKEGGSSNRLREKLEKTKKDFFASLDDDLNTPKAFSTIFSFIRDIYKIDLSKERRQNIYDSKLFIDDVGDIFGIKLINKFTLKQINELAIIAKSLGIESTEENNGETLLKGIIGLRSTFRSSKDYKTTDLIRKKLLEIGIILEDDEDNTVWKLKFNGL
jgi:cysteinyl-tRNA synthetase